MKYIQMNITILILLILSGCGSDDKAKKKGLATFSELTIDFGCRGLTNDGKNLICGTGYGSIISIDPYTGKTSEIYDVDQELEALGYMGNGKYVFQETKSYLHTFDIHKDLKDTLHRKPIYGSSGLVYDQKNNLLFQGIGESLTARNLDSGSTIGKYKPILATGEWLPFAHSYAMAQTDKYIYTASTWDGYIIQVKKSDIINSINHPPVEIIYNKGYFDGPGDAYGISGMTTFHGEIFIYYQKDSTIHKLDVNLADYGDPGPHF